MAFDDRDGTVQIPQAVDSTVEEIRFVRNRGLPGVPLEIHVYKSVGSVRRHFRVPQNLVDAAWPGTTRSLKNHLLSIIDAAT